MTTLSGTRPLAIAPSAERFVIVILITCIFLQRFAVPVIGDALIPFATPLVLATALVGLHTGMLILNGRRTMLFCALVVSALASTSLSLIVNISPSRMTSFESVAYAMMVTSFATLSFADPMREERFYKLFLTCVTVVAIAGLLQFIAQFFGVLAFTFSGIVPDWMLMERGFGPFQPLSYESSIFRSNGFFLLEPSFMGQLMALGIMIETTGERRPLRLLLFVTGILTAVSGTGMLVLAAFVVSMAVAAGTRAILPLLLVAIAISVIFVVLQMALPEVAEALINRSGEIAIPGSSGNARFVGAFLILGDVFQNVPWAILTGVGPGIAEHLTVSYDYGANTVTKYVVEYGVVSFGIYLTLILSAQRNYRQNMLLFPLVVDLLFAGQNQQFSIMVFPILLIITVARFESVTQ